MRSIHSRSLVTISVLIASVLFGGAGCGQLLGLDEDKGRIDGDPDDAALCACDDGNPCTVDSCTGNATSACRHDAAPDGIAPSWCDSGRCTSSGSPAGAR